MGYQHAADLFLSDPHRETKHRFQGFVEDIGSKKTRSRRAGRVPNVVFRKLEKRKHNEQETIRRWPELEHDRQ